MHLVTSFFVSVNFFWLRQNSAIFAKKLKYQPGCYFYNLKSFFEQMSHMQHQAMVYTSSKYGITDPRKISHFSKKEPKTAKIPFFQPRKLQGIDLLEFECKLSIVSNSSLSVVKMSGFDFYHVSLQYWTTNEQTKNLPQVTSSRKNFEIFYTVKKRIFYLIPLLTCCARLWWIFRQFGRQVFAQIRKMLPKKPF